MKTGSARMCRAEVVRCAKVCERCLRCADEARRDGRDDFAAEWLDRSAYWAERAEWWARELAWELAA